MGQPVSCDEAVRRIGAIHGPEIERLWREDLARRRARAHPAACAQDQEPARAPPEALAGALRSLRRQRGLSQERLGELVGHSRTHITKIERGTVPLANGTFARIIEALGTNAAEVEAQVLAGKGAS